MGSTRICVRVSDDVLASIRARGAPWPGSPTDSYVVRYVLEQGLDAMDAETMAVGGPNHPATPEAR